MLVWIGLLLSLLNLVHSWQEKVDPKLLSKLQTTETAQYLILVTPYPLDTTNVPPLERPAYVFKTLTKHTEVTQASLVEYLTQAQISFKSYWVSNVIVTTTNLALLTEIAQRDEVVHIEENTPFQVPLETPEEIFYRNVTTKRQDRFVEWNVEYVRADDAWDLYNFHGEGFVVANADTGVQWNHPALIQQYRGSNGGSVDHNYNWWDAIHETGSSCGASSRVPCDDNGHGTHTTGTAVGYDHIDYHIGVAYGADWIACRNMNAGWGVPTTYIECLQFFIAPHDLNGNNPDPSKAPHVIGNSYGCTSAEGCNARTLDVAVRNVIQAGIFMSVSAGNSGPSCNSINEPPASVQGVCSVGALGYQSSIIASYSSRGPIEGVRPGPSFAAPGSSVTSCYPGNRYATLSGTSMASPAVTGAVPIVWQGKSNLVRNVAATVTHLEASCQRIDASQCGSSGSPNHVYGHGLMNVYAALELP